MKAEMPPKDFQTLKTLILAQANVFPKRLIQVATYALAHPDEIAFGTVASIAAAAGVQPSTLIRFSQSLGYVGFSELQTVFRAPLREKVLNYEERMAQLRGHANSASHANQIFHGLTEASAKSLSDLREKLHPAHLDRAVAQLEKANTIYLIGLRRSYPISTYMSYAFGKLGLRNVLIDAAGGLAQEALSFAGPKDCVLAISFAPYASETVSLTKAAHSKNVPIVAITDSGFSPIATLAKATLEVSEANFEGFRSMAATLALAMTLTVAVAEARGRKK